MKTIPQRDLRNHCSEILREAEAGQQFSITVDGRPVAVLGPAPRERWVAKERLSEFAQSLPEDPTFFEDIAGMAELTELVSDPWQR
jgi:prevent-host-death family protein